MGLNTAFLTFLILLGFLFIIGSVAHEMVHWFFGWAAGGNPCFSSFRFKIWPREVDFDTPSAMSNRAVRLVGGGVFLFPLLLVVHSLDAALTPTKLHLPWAIFLLGGSGISWYDQFAASEPELWKAWTSGQDINRSEIESSKGIIRKILGW